MRSGFSIIYSISHTCKVLGSSTQEKDFLREVADYILVKEVNKLNLKDRILYEILEENKTILIIRAKTHYGQ